MAGSTDSMVQAVKLYGVDYNSLFGFNSTSLDDMNGFMDAFSQATIVDVTADVR